MVQYVCKHQTMWYCFAGKNFMVHLSTTTTMKISPPKNTRYTVLLEWKAEEVVPITHEDM